MPPRNKKTEQATPKGLDYVTDLAALPRRKGGVREVPAWLTDAPKGAHFNPKWLVERALYKSASAASAALMRYSRTLLGDDGKPTKTDNPDGMLEQVSRGVYRKVA